MYEWQSNPVVIKFFENREKRKRGEEVTDLLPVMLDNPFGVGGLLSREKAYIYAMPNYHESKAVMNRRYREAEKERKEKQRQYEHERYLIRKDDPERKEQLKKRRKELYDKKKNDPEYKAHIREKEMERMARIRADPERYAEFLEKRRVIEKRANDKRRAAKANEMSELKGES